jgi:hypothetical protein
MAEHEACYHCGLPIPADEVFSVEIGGVKREMCCHGCSAVAQAIVDNGLADYYRHRCRSRLPTSACSIILTFKRALCALSKARRANTCAKLR